jgi:Zn-dependent M28 family amino/carboxypeptidase
MRSRTPLKPRFGPALAGLMALAVGMTPALSPTAGTQAGKVQADRLRAHVEMLAANLSPRDYQHPENLDRVAAYIAAGMREAGLSVRDQAFERDGKTYRNVIGDLGPATRERIVLGAHYDAFGGFPGADDNASGVASLLELGRLLAPEKLPLRVELVAYTLEEPPFFAAGSAVHAASLRREAAEVRAMLSLEMLGYYDDARDSQRYPNALIAVFHPDQGNFISVIGQLGGFKLVRRIKQAMSDASPLPVRSLNAPRFVPGVDFSDHASYWNLGYPAAMITDTAFYRNPHYHSATDTPGTLDYDRMAQVVAGLHAAVLMLALE